MRAAIRIGTVAFLLCILPRTAAGQGNDRVEVTAFGGYRFGGDFFEIASRRPVDADGAPAFGIVINVPFSSETQIEALISHQRAQFTIPAANGVPEARLRVTVDHYQVGGLTEMGTGRAVPFLTGLLGLTRYEASGNNELRFSLSAGGGVKLFPTRHLGARLDGRLFGTLVDAEADVLVCGGGLCVGSIDASFVWQAEFTAGVVIRF
jgi:hypothetical protein